MDGKLAIPLRAQLSLNGQSSATIDLFDCIDPYWGFGVNTLSDQLKNYADLELINLRIHSRGGSAIEAFAIYTILMLHKAKVEVDVIGIAASAASVVAMAGDVVRISEVGQIMIHNAWTCACGNSAQLRRAADQLEALDPQIVKAYERRVTRVGVTTAQLAEWMAAGDGEGTWFDSEKAVKFGFADAISSVPLPQNSIRLEDMKNVPDAVLKLWGGDGAPPVGDLPPAEEPSQALLTDVLAYLSETSPVRGEALNAKTFDLASKLFPATATT